MIDWIIENKNWLFSGVGVTIILGLIYLVKNILNKKNNEKVTSISLPTEPSSQNKKTIISPKEIYDLVENLPPLQKEAVLENYSGLFVEWKTKLRFAQKHWIDKSLIFLILRYQVKKHDSIDITCSVNADLNKELFITKKNADILVSGEIGKISESSACINLINAKISIIELKNANK